ncbi:metalloregulator ArsR/SmtB family transcription factor [Glutamicibacter nicotianae]|uniref:metalloregulator ArsR/SmtB family transcription factor n=1 Tax=Glutamicibacter nicotianae TaxID=37929 RepID=UPI00195A5AE3|nr:metalloregulator ArsR/SmtB family transcription factor [Glutamicibacter nicotianae]MBM7769610.1 DNA-binding transcriptional ArsR family regulator [Glutamicibacter nicotianae]
MLDVLEVAAEPTRKRLIQMLGSGERTVTELARHFPVSRSAISQHLLLLIEAGLLNARKDGRQRYPDDAPSEHRRSADAQACPEGRTTLSQVRGRRCSTPAFPH